MANFPNDMTQSGDDNSIRPWTNGYMEHNDPLATILLFTDAGAAASLENNKINYLNNLSNSVKKLTTESVSNPQITTGIPDTYGNIDFSGTPDQTAGGKIPVLKLDNRNYYYGVFNNFCLTGFTEMHDQIVKVHMNFSASWNAFFFGNSPNVYQFRGYFIDASDYPYYQEFMVAYDKYLSGRKAIENRLQTKLVVAGQIMDGYLLSVSVSHNANTTALKEFTFSMLVKGSSWIRTNIVKNFYYESGTTQFNGLSNSARLSQQFLNGLIDKLGITDDSSNKHADITKRNQ